MANHQDRPNSQTCMEGRCIFFWFVINTTAYHLGGYSLHLLQLKSSVRRLIGVNSLTTKTVRFRSASVESNDDVLSTATNNNVSSTDSREFVEHTCAKSQLGVGGVGQQLEGSTFPEWTPSSEKLLLDKTGENVFGGKKSSRKQFRPQDIRGPKGRTLPRVQTLPSGGFYRLQRPCDDVVSGPHDINQF